MPEDSASYLAKMLIGESEQQQAQQTLQMHFLTCAIGILLMDMIKRLNLDDRKGIRKALMEGWMEAVEDTHKAQIDKHRKMMESGPIGKLISTMAGDAEDLEIVAKNMRDSAKKWTNEFINNVFKIVDGLENLEKHSS